MKTEKMKTQNIELAEATQPQVLEKTTRQATRLKSYKPGKETYCAYAVQDDDCAAEYTTRDEAIAYLRASAFQGRRDVTIWPCAEASSKSTLSNESTFLELRSQLRKNGMTQREQQLARQDELHHIEATLWSCQPIGLDIELHQDCKGADAHVRLNNLIGIWPIIKPGIGRALRLCYAVQSIWEDDNDPEYPTLKQAVVDALLRLERARIEQEFEESERSLSQSEAGPTLTSENKKE